MSDGISLVPAIRISSSGLEAESRRMEVIANNVANMHSSGGKDGTVFRRKEIIFAEHMKKAVRGGRSERRGSGVEIKGIVDDKRPPKRRHKPGHPDADKDGYINMPNIDPTVEMIDMMSATRAYEANLAAIKAAKDMARQALAIGK